MTPEQQALWMELLELLDRFQRQEPAIIDQGNQIADEFIHNPVKMASALNRSAEASPYARNGSEKDPEKLIRSVMNKHPGALAVRDIVELIAAEHGRQLSQWGVRSVLKNMTDQAVVVASGEKSKVYQLTDITT
jgi:hypothetical protein